MCQLKHNKKATTVKCEFCDKQVHRSFKCYHRALANLSRDSRTMNGSTMIRTVAVHRPTPPVPCGTLRVGRHTRWRIEVQPALIPRSADQPISRSPPPLLLAQGRASCRTPLRAPDLSRSRHLDVLLSRSAVRQAGLSVAAKEAAVAGFNEQLAALVLPLTKHPSHLLHMH